MSRFTLTFFLLIVSFGILLAGCAGSEPDKSFDEFVFSDTDLAQVHDLAASDATSVSSSISSLDNENDSANTAALSLAGSSATVLTDLSIVMPDKEKQARYDALRTVVVDEGGNIYRVNNPFLNVRSDKDVSSALVVRLNQGDIVTVLDILSAEWAKVKLSNGSDGYVAFRYLAKLTTEEKLPLEKKQFEGKYYVDFQFLNIRKDPSTQSEKLGELLGQAIIKPISMNGEWARVVYNGKEGYVSTQYLKPFQPVFLVRQDQYTLPILQYFADDSASIGSIQKQMTAIKAAGKKIVTLKTLYDIVMAQETRDARVSPGTIVLTVSGVNAKNIRAVSDALEAGGVAATLFIQTKDIGLSGITEKMAINLMANGNDLQSAGHTGDDLRSMTDSQVILELGQSKKLIQDLTHKEVYGLSYPKGGINDRVMKQAADIGYLFGISQSPDSRFSRSQFLRLPTLLVSPGMSPDDVTKLVK